MQSRCSQVARPTFTFHQLLTRASLIVASHEAFEIPKIDVHALREATVVHLGLDFGVSFGVGEFEDVDCLLRASLTMLHNIVLGKVLVIPDNRLQFGYVCVQFLGGQHRRVQRTRKNRRKNSVCESGIHGTLRLLTALIVNLPLVLILFTCIKEHKVIVIRVKDLERGVIR